MKVENTNNGNTVSLYPNIDVKDIDDGVGLHLKFETIVPFLFKDGELYALEVKDSWSIDYAKDLSKLVMTLTSRFHTYCFRIFNEAMLTDEAFKLSERDIELIKKMPSQISDYKYILKMMDNGCD